ncbi:MAG: hypothetical protein CL846_06230 [Crocinitomicaceae bacterium]|nr:hypothetical protein [Crocinitomicaceae bacterium]|tara:strand:+ start:5054 stop:7324 length:2271 start_codon:yes stop_codon:yes gene_type:complete
MKLSFFVLFVFYFLIGFSQSQKKEILNGRVFEINADSLSPLPGVHVYYSGTKKGSTTDKNGFFQLEHDHNKEALVFSFIGYKPDTLIIDHDQEINIIMGEGKVLKDFEVEFKKGSYFFSKINPINAHIIGQDELRKAACCNLAESFETNPSIDATFTDAVTGTKQIKMMGLSGKYVQMLSGNIPAIRGLSSLYGLKQIPGAFIHQISVSKGAGSVLNGYESMVGQLNMNLKHPENAEKFHLNVYLNQAGRTEYNAFFTQKVTKKWETTFSAHFEDQSKKNDRNEDGFLDAPLHNDYIFFNQWNYRSKKIHIELGAHGVLSNMKSGAIDQTFSYPVNIENQQVNSFAKIGYLFPKDDFKSLALQLSGSYTNQNSTIGLTSYSGRQYSGYANLIYQQELGENDASFFKIGASCQLDSVNENVQSNTIYPPINRFLEIVPGVFGEYTYNTEKWGVIAGLRADYTNFYNNYFVTPRLHLRHNFNNETALKLMAGSGRRTPYMLMENIGLMASSRSWLLDNNVYGMVGLMTDVGQEYSWNIGMALLKEFTLFHRDGVLTIDAYHTYFINQLVVDLYQSAREVHFYALDGKSYSNSFQVEINYDLNRRVKIRTAYRYLDVRTDYNSLHSHLLMRNNPFVSKHRGFLNIDYTTRKKKDSQWKVDVTAQWIGSQQLPTTEDNPSSYKLEASSPNYMLLNGQITRIFNKTTELYLGIENALNFRQPNPILSAENPQSPYFDSSIIWGPIFGRMIYIGGRFTLNRD